MKIIIDNFDGVGPRDYTHALVLTPAPRVLRRLNRGAEFAASLVGNTPDFVVPGNGARVILQGPETGPKLFTGYLTSAPGFEYLGWGERGPVYRYDLRALSDELLLNQKTLSPRQAFVARTAGDALRQLTNDLLPAHFDTAGVEELEIVPVYGSTPQKSWSEQAAEIAQQVRASYQAQDAKLLFASIGAATYAFHEVQPNFSPDGLKLRPTRPVVNDVTIVGLVEPRGHVKNYFIGDGFSLRFDLPLQPSSRFSKTLLDEEYDKVGLDPTRWTVADPGQAVSVSGGKLQVDGGSGLGQTTVKLAEQIEIGGALILQHGDISFDAPSAGILGGLYNGGLGLPACMAGFQLAKVGAQSVVQPIVNGTAVGSSIATQSGHRYAFTTRLYASEVYRKRQTFHSSKHQAGNARGGDQISANVRLVLEVHDIDLANPGSLVGPATVLYEGVIAGAPDYCSYGVVNASDMHCAIAFTRVTRAVDAEVRSELPGQAYRTRLTGSLSEGAECRISSEPAVHFYGQYVPAPGEKIMVRYRTGGRSVSRILDAASVASLQQPGDNGTRGIVRHVKLPSARTSVDCENAALAVLDDSVLPGWAGEYRTWSGFLPGGAQDIFPGDGLDVNIPSRGAQFVAIVREVEIEVADIFSERSKYRIVFADEAAEPVALSFNTAGAGDPVNTTSGLPPSGYLAEVSAAEFTDATSTTVSIDAGSMPPVGGGFEVRRTDSGWGMANDRNLAGRFVTRNFTLPRLSRVQDYYLRQYDSSVPPKYSRNSILLHLDYPL
jgi:hypothetical protein